MIYFLDNGKFKATNWQSAENLKKKTGVDEIYEPEKLNKELAKGNHVYCWIDPYKEEINEFLMIYWGTDLEVELNFYYNQLEEI